MYQILIVKDKNLIPYDFAVIGKIEEKRPVFLSHKETVLLCSRLNERENTPGSQAIANERAKQISKYNYDIGHDFKINYNGELIQAAIYALTLNEIYYPISWGDSFRTSLKSKPYEERVTIAGALLASELDVIIHQNRKQCQAALGAK